MTKVELAIIIIIGWVAAHSVAYSAAISLSVVNINTVNGEEPTAEYTEGGNYGRTIKNATKVPASMKIIDGNGNLVYESGEYSKGESGLTIKLRGNTSVFLDGKSSYKLKLQKKADLLASLISRSDEVYQDKDWILLKVTKALDTFVGLSVCDIVGVPWTPKFAFVDVIVNNDYRGMYMLVECIERGESRVNISETGYIIERDAYWWNESVRFITQYYSQKFTFKYPDADDITKSQISYIEEYMNTLEQYMRNGVYEDFVDVESFARWIFVHDYLGSLDNAGSNIYMAKYDNTEKTKLHMLTNWDFDSNYMQENKWSVQHEDYRVYAPSLFESDDRTFIETYKRLYERFAPVLWDSLKVRLENLKSTLGKQIKLSCYRDSQRWEYEQPCTVERVLDVAQKWFLSRKEWLRNAIEKNHAVSYELNGGDFKKEDAYPDSINFLDRFKIPQPQKEGYVFTGWTSSLNLKPKKDFVLYGYKMTGEIELTAQWADEALFGDSIHSYEFDVFSVKGERLGRIEVKRGDLHSISRVLKDAGYASGIYIIRGDLYDRVLRVGDKGYF